MVRVEQIAERARVILKREIFLRRRVNYIASLCSCLRPAAFLEGQVMTPTGIEVEIPSDSIRDMDIDTLSEMHLEFPLRDLAAKVYRFQNFFAIETPKAVEFAGTIIDLDIGMVLRFVRMFDPTICRFINRFDVLGY